MNRSVRLVWLISILSTVLGSCAAVPEPRLIYQDTLTRVDVRVDRKADRPHGHPASLTPVQIGMILAGMRVQTAGMPLYSTVVGRPDPLPAFSTSDVIAISKPISEALATAKPTELVTFYRRVSDAAVGLAYTTGGIFVEENLVYIILANHRVKPMDANIRDVPMYATDPISNPLLSLGTARYTLSFERTEAQVKPIKGTWNYDPSKNYDPYRTIIVDPTLAQRSLATAP
ncbi:MAG: hypothetical protein GDA67_02315 [Nitrospira sp. CR1.3]|nr:hypothetical protein [Nitrospira sp. CR1.3]